MRKLLGIVVLGLLFSGSANASDNYYKTPKNEAKQYVGLKQIDSWFRIW